MKRLDTSVAKGKWQRNVTSVSGTQFKQCWHFVDIHIVPMLCHDITEPSLWKGVQVNIELPKYYVIIEQMHFLNCIHHVVYVYVFCIGMYISFFVSGLVKILVKPVSVCLSNKKFEYEHTLTTPDSPLHGIYQSPHRGHS